jgi:hypothetical protein
VPGTSVLDRARMSNRNSRRGLVPRRGGSQVTSLETGTDCHGRLMFTVSQWCHSGSVRRDERNIQPEQARCTTCGALPKSIL